MLEHRFYIEMVCLLCEFEDVWREKKNNVNEKIVRSIVFTLLTRPIEKNVLDNCQLDMKMVVHVQEFSMGD